MFGSAQTTAWSLSVAEVRSLSVAEVWSLSVAEVRSLSVAEVRSLSGVEVVLMRQNPIHLLVPWQTVYIEQFHERVWIEFFYIINP